MPINPNFIPGQVLTAAELNAQFGLAAAASDLANTSDPTKGAALVAFKQNASGSVGRAVSDELSDLWVNVKRFGAKGDGVTDDTLAIQLAITFLALNGGGRLFFPAGTFIVSNSNASSTSWDTNCGIWVLSNNIYLVGAGVNVTEISMANNANSHTICFGQRTNGTVTVSYGGVSDMTVNGNRLNQNAAIDSSNYHNAGIMVQSGCTNIQLQRLYVHDCMWYGIGFQRDGFYNCLIRDVYISNTGVDLIDWKNDSDNSYGNVIDNVSGDNWGLLPVATTADPSAAFDLRSGIAAGKLIARLPGQSAVAGIRFQNGTPGATPVQASSIRVGEVTGASVSGSAGVRVISRGVVVEGVTATGFDDGISGTEPDCRYAGNYVMNNVTSGMRLWNNSGAGTLASNNEVIGLVARGNATGVITDGSIAETEFTACDVRANTTYGYDVRSGCQSINIIGGSAEGNGASSAANVNDNGTSTIIRSVRGYKTFNVGTATVAIDSTGTKSFSIAHGFPFTPQIGDVRLDLQRNTNIGDWSAGFCWVTSCDATNINGQLRVLTASATSGALVTVAATIDSKNR